MSSHDETRTRRTSTAWVLAPALTMALAFAGCGGSSSKSSAESTPSAATPPTTASSAATSTPAAPSAAGSSSLTLAADPSGQLKFDKSSLTAKAGTVKLNFTNASSLAHDVTVESSAGASVGATPTFQGGSKTVSLNLKPGTYKFYCSVPGHRQAGMEGTLTVN
jgi:plastocyanin